MPSKPFGIVHRLAMHILTIYSYTHSNSPVSSFLLDYIPQFYIPTEIDGHHFLDYKLAVDATTSQLQICRVRDLDQWKGQQSSISN